MQRFLFITILIIFTMLSACAQTSTDYSNQKQASLNSSASTTVVPSPTSTSTLAPTPQPTPQKPNLELVESHTTNDEFSAYVEGTVKNNTNNRYSYVGVEINLYDKDGNQVGSTLDNTTNFEAGGTWKFKAVAMGDNVSKYKIVKVDGM